MGLIKGLLRGIWVRVVSKLHQLEKKVRWSSLVSFHSFCNPKYGLQKNFFNVDAIKLAAYAEQLLPRGKAAMCCILGCDTVWTHFKNSKFYFILLVYFSYGMWKSNCKVEILACFPKPRHNHKVVWLAGPLKISSFAQNFLYTKNSLNVVSRCKRHLKFLEFNSEKVTKFWQLIFLSLSFAGLKWPANWSLWVTKNYQYKGPYLWNRMTHLGSGRNRVFDGCEYL